MARIWYSVCGEGMGHAVRSAIIIEHLRKKHDVIVTAADDSFPYLAKKFPRVYKINGYKLSYRDNAVALSGVLKLYTGSIPKDGRANFRLMRTLMRTKPDILISDFESYSMAYAVLHHIPRMYVDNIHVLTECKLRFPQMKRPWQLFCSTLISLFYPPADHVVLFDFAGIRPRRPKKVTMTVPLVRDSVRGMPPTREGFVLVYQTTNTNQRLKRILSRSDRPCKVYGMGIVGKRGNIEYKRFDEAEFARDLAACEYVIVNGGFTVISEAIFLKKPILCVPIRMQVEQYNNALMVARKGYGSFSEKLTAEDLRSFERNLHRYQKNLEKVKQWSNGEVFRRVDAVVDRLLRKRRRKLLKKRRHR